MNARSATTEPNVAKEPHLISDLGLFILVIASFFSSIMGAIASGGGGFIMTPLLILFGLTPAQAVATGKISGLATTVGSLGGMRGIRMKDKRLLVILLALALLAGLISPRIIVNLGGDVYVIILGITLILIAPVIYLKKLGHFTKQVSKNHRIVGYFITFIALLLQGVFSSGLGIFVSIAMMAVLGLNALEANVSKRSVQLLLNSTIILSLVGTGLIIWRVALTVVFANLAGSYIGGKIAVKKGPRFVSFMLAVLAFMGGVALLIKVWT